MSEFSELWRARYGSAEAPAIDGLADFLQHRSVRDFDLGRPVSEELIAGLVAAAQSASTSSNLQLYSVVSIEDPDLRAQVNEHCSNQRQVALAPWFFGFFVDHHRLRHKLAELEISADSLDYADYFLMGVVDAALAAERMVVAAECLGLGVCYIGALRNNPVAIAQLLGMPSGLFGVFGLCIGYPDPAKPAAVKPRLSQDRIWFRDRYDAEAGIGDYDERMAAFFASEKQDPSVTWSARSGRRLEEKYMTRRQVVLNFLRDSGLLRR
ncbi:MAG: nitroreductase family protein [Chthonomonas sp.]|nr:nitroreductase family protein [Chthonomonas sp.]